MAPRVLFGQPRKSRRQRGQSPEPLVQAPKAKKGAKQSAKPKSTSKGKGKRKIAKSRKQPSSQATRPPNKKGVAANGPPTTPHGQIQADQTTTNAGPLCTFARDRMDADNGTLLCICNDCTQDDRALSVISSNIDFDHLPPPPSGVGVSDQQSPVDPTSSPLPSASEIIGWGSKFQSGVEALRRQRRLHSKNCSAISARLKELSEAYDDQNSDLVTSGEGEGIDPVNAKEEYDKERSKYENELQGEREKRDACRKSLIEIEERLSWLPEDF